MVSGKEAETAKERQNKTDEAITVIKERVAVLESSQNPKASIVPSTPCDSTPPTSPTTADEGSNAKSTSRASFPTPKATNGSLESAITIGPGHNR
ncbi:unnamed protein product [Urochloa humidicola]